MRVSTDDLVSLQIEDSLYLDTLGCFLFIIVTPLVTDSSCEAFAHNHLGFMC